MVNLTVVNVKDVIKYLVKVTLVIVIIVTATRFFCGIKSEKFTKLTTQKAMIYVVKDVVPGVKQFFKTDDKILKLGNTYKIALNSELEIAKEITNKINERVSEFDEDDEEEKIIEENKIEKQNVENIKTDVTTEIIEDKYNVYSVELFGVKIKNESNYQLVENEYNVNNEISNKNNVLLFHTHTCESYTVSSNFKYEETGNYRTTDLNFTVARVDRKSTR